MHEDFHRSFFNRDRLIHIVDPDPGTCEALSVVFRLEGYQTLFSLDAPGFLASLERRCPEAVIINLRLRKGDGLSVLRHLKTMRRSIPVFVLEDRRQVENAVAAMKAGATDVLSKPIDMDYLVRAVRDALRQDIGSRPARDDRRSIPVRGFSLLTPREREVLQLVAEGRSNKEAGRELGISPRTIEVHRARVMEKLGARNAADLMRIVLTGSD